MTALEGMSEEPVARGRRARQICRSPERSGAIMEAARRLTHAGVAAEDIAVRRPTLDDVFLSLTGHAAGRRATDAGAGGGGRMTRDTLVLAERNLVRLPRNPDMLLAFTVQPIMFVLLFAFVFGGAIETPGLRRLHRLPDPGDDRAADRVRRVRDRARPRRGHDQGPDRPLPLAADGARLGARRPHAGGHRDEPAVDRDPARDRPRDRLPLRRERAGDRRRRSACCCCSATRSAGSSR